VRRYLEQLEVDGASLDPLPGKKELASMMAEAMKIESFLRRRFYHSMTYLSFSSGLAVFADAHPCSRCDRFAYGPDFLAEPDGHDTAFVKATMISGFPFLAFVTKTRAHVRRTDEPARFDSFYYNYTFQMGVIRRWASRRIRIAMAQSYYQEIGRAVEGVLWTHSRPVAGGNRYGVSINPVAFDELNDALARVAKAIPFAQVHVEQSWSTARTRQLKAMPQAGCDPDLQSFWVFNLKFYFWFEPNNYYTRKFINSDWRFLKRRSVQRAIQDAVTRLKSRWSLIPV
jgi:hypothetical protein